MVVLLRNKGVNFTSKEASMKIQDKQVIEELSISDFNKLKSAFSTAFSFFFMSAKPEDVKEVFSQTK